MGPTTDLSLDEVVEAVQQLVPGSRPVRPTDLLVADLGMDVIQLMQVTCHLEALRPGCRLPTQMDIEDVRVADLHHFLTLPHGTG